MSDDDRLATLFSESIINVLRSWICVLVLASSAVIGMMIGRYEAVLFSLIAVVIILVPVLMFRDLTVMPPWYFLVLVCLPVLLGTFVPTVPVTTFFPSLALATLGLLLMVNLHRFTSLRLVPWFTIVLTVLFTLAMACALNLLRWVSDILFETSFLLDGRTQDAINASLMIEFFYVTTAGLVAGMIFYRYFQQVSQQPVSRMVAPSPPERKTPAESAVLSERLHVSTARQRQVALTMQIILSLVLVYGIWTQQLSLFINATVALAITFIPAVLGRDYGIPIEPGLALWITSAVFLHALGSIGFYGIIPSWDTLTHTLSATVVAAAGYTTLRAIHLHATAIHLPSWAMFIFTLVFVLAMGVIWELLEFFTDQGALLFGLDPVLAQHGINDTISDLLFNTVGALLVATWGTAYLIRVSEHLATQLESRFNV
ncbi:hypothetical protein [Haloterrigena salinisoli]|uniref:hypothetical protein n=1 Tax=Haloterrigena salinisoli TaxID=3132747 RepID=UPI0030D24589